MRSLDRRSFAERAEVLAVDEPPPYAVRVKLVLAVQNSHRRRSTVQIVETYATNFFFIMLIRILAATRLDTGENVALGRIAGGRQRRWIWEEYRNKETRILGKGINSRQGHTNFSHA